MKTYRYTIKDEDIQVLERAIIAMVASFRFIKDLPIGGFIEEDLLEKSTQEINDILCCIRSTVCPTTGNTTTVSPEFLRAAYNAERKRADGLETRLVRLELLARRVASLNPDAGEIGAGMLRTLVIDARRALES